MKDEKDTTAEVIAEVKAEIRSAAEGRVARHTAEAELAEAEVERWTAEKNKALLRRSAWCDVMAAADNLFSKEKDGEK